MLRSNLSTRPFYNERAVHVLIGLAAAIVLGITALNVVRILVLSRHNTELSSRVNSEHNEAVRLTQEAAAIRQTINKDELEQVVGAAQEANSLIDQRTFSWTAFFNRIESTLPPDVMLSAVRPSVKAGLTNVQMMVLAKRAEDVDEFMEKLEATGAFENVVPAAQDRTDAGLYRVTVDSIYTDVVDEATEAPASGSAAPPAAPGAGANAPPPTVPNPHAAPAAPKAPAVPPSGRRGRQ